MKPEWIAFAGLAFTVYIACAGIFYKLGHHAARLEEIEKWRPRVRDDFHEVSKEIGELKDKVGIVDGKVDNVITLINERTTNRRSTDSESTLALKNNK